MSSSYGGVTRRDVVKACKRRQWTIQPAALQGILEHADTEQDLQSILDLLSGSKIMSNAKTITVDHWKQLVRQQQQEREEQEQPQRQVGSGQNNRSKGQQQRQAANESTNTSNTDLEVVSAFDTPKLVYESMRKQFHIDEKVRSLFGTPDDKVNMLRQRYALIHQRLLRRDLFRPNNLGHSGGGTSATPCKLTPIESLLGKSTKNSHSRTILLLAVLIQIEEGQYYLEDPTGQLPVQFQQSVMASLDGFFVTEQCILLVEGSFQDGLLFVHRLGHPLLETRADSLTAIQQQISHPAYSLPPGNNKPMMADDDDASFVFLSDLNLDQPRTLQQLEGLLATYESYSPNRLPCFVLMGNFSSISAACNPNNQHLEELGSLLMRFTSLAQHAHFVLVPGPNDSNAAQVLPCPNMLSRNGFSSSRIKHVHWATNPCRIRFNGKEMVIFRYDLLSFIQRQQVLSQDKNNNNNTARVVNYDEDNEEDSEDERNHLRKPHCRLVKTILDQGYLVPAANVPVYWNYSHALGLYPLPDVLVLGGDSSIMGEGFHEIYGGCHVIHPGSSLTGNYATFQFETDAPFDDVDSDDSDIEDGAGRTGDARVDFGNLGGA